MSGSEIKHILLEPEEGDPHGLLKEGSCGSRPPMARKFGLPRLMHTSNEFADPTYNGEKCVACGQPWPCDTPGEVEQVADEKWVPWPHAVSSPCALVLAWDGEPVAEGIFSVWYQQDDTGTEVLGSWLYDGRTMAELARSIAMRRRDGRALGTLVLLDAEGREVSDE